MSWHVDKALHLQFLRCGDNILFELVRTFTSLRNVSLTMSWHVDKALHLQFLRCGDNIQFQLVIEDNEHLPAYLTTKLLGKSYNSIKIENSINSNFNSIHLTSSSIDQFMSTIELYVLDMKKTCNARNQSYLMPSINCDIPTQPICEAAAKAPRAEPPLQRKRDRDEFESTKMETDAYMPSIKKQKLNSNHNIKQNKEVTEKAELEEPDEPPVPDWSKRFLAKKMLAVQRDIEGRIVREDGEYEIQDIQGRIVREDGE
eukprot:457559_1